MAVTVVIIVYNCTPFLHSLLTKGKPRYLRIKTDYADLRQKLTTQTQTLETGPLPTQLLTPEPYTLNPKPTP